MGFGGVQLLRDYGEWRHAFPVRDVLREPPADADLAVLQAGIPSHPAARQNGPTGAAVLFLNFGYNHGSDCVKIKDEETGRIVHSRDVTWHQPREPLISPGPAVGSEVPQTPSGTATPEYIHIQLAPAATTAPAAAPMPASDNAAPALPRNPTAPIREKEKEKTWHSIRRIAHSTSNPNAMPRFFNHTRLEVTLGVSVHLLADCPEQAIPVRLHIDNVEPL